MPLHLHTAQDDDIMQTTTTMTAQRDLHQTICLLDWDDTLCCSSWLLHQNQSLDSPPLYDLSRPLQPGDDRTLIEAREMALQLKALEDVLITLLKQAMAQATRVVIVTNAERGWVELSASRWLPGVLPLLSQLTIISARSTYEHLFPQAIAAWKYHAMRDLLIASGLLTSECRLSIISLGDSHVERAAVHAVHATMCRARPQPAYVKSVKFVDRASCEQLRRQLELVTQCLGYLLNHEANLDLQLTLTPANTNNANPNTNANQPNTAAAQPAPAVNAAPVKPVNPSTAMSDEGETHTPSAPAVASSPASHSPIPAPTPVPSPSSSVDPEQMSEVKDIIMDHGSAASSKMFRSAFNKAAANAIPHPAAAAVAAVTSVASAAINNTIPSVA